MSLFDLFRPPSARVSEVRADLVTGPTGVVPAPVIKSPWAPDPDHLGTVVWSDLFGAEWVPLTRPEAMAIPAIKRARNVVAATLGRCPIEAVRGPEDDPQPVTPTPTVLAQPDPAQARFVTLTWAVDDLIFYGVSWFVALQRAADGRILHIRRVHPGGVEEKAGRFYVYGRETPAADVLRIDGPDEGILNSSSRSLRAARSLEQSAARFADNPVPAVELHQTEGPDLTDPEIDALTLRWADARRGKNGGVAFTSKNVEAKVHGSPSEHLLTAGRNAAALDCARVVGVPADAIDATPENASMTYANVESRGRTLIDYGLAFYAAAIEGRLSMDDVLPHGTRARWDLSAITAPSAANDEPTTEGAS